MAELVRVAVDAMGGDNAPLEIVRGALDANRNHGVEIILVGRTAEVLKAVEACGDVDTMILDKTGTITYRNRLAAEL